MLLLAAALAGCAGQPADTSIRSSVAYADLPGWGKAPLLPALQVFAASCHRPAPDILRACRDFAAAPPRSETAAVNFIESHFQPLAIEAPDGRSDGLFTGYFEPELRGSLTRQGPFATPLYAMPDTPPPYPARAEIDRGALQGKARVVVWVDDPVAAFFLQVQGSGRVRLVQGGILALAYAGNNGKPYTAIGKTLVAQGDLQPGAVDADSIAAWLRQHPEQAPAIMESDARYVFFKQGGQEGPVGAAGRVLVPGISMAVDPQSIPLGSLVWLALDPASGQATPRLMLADDKGIAIQGAVRGDLYLGSGADAGAEAALLKARGRYWLLEPLP